MRKCSFLLPFLFTGPLDVRCRQEQPARGRLTTPAAETVGGQAPEHACVGEHGIDRCVIEKAHGLIGISSFNDLETFVAQVRRRSNPTQDIFFDDKESETGWPAVGGVS